MLAGVPETSTTMLRDIAGDAEHPRWREFVARYRPMLEAFMAQRFPGLEADDLIQETFIAVACAIPGYRYAPDEKGRFRNLLTGILHHKTLNTLRSSKRRAEFMEKYAAEFPAENPPGGAEEEQWRETLFEIALSHVMDNPDIPERSKRIFERTAINGEKPEDVAHSLAVSRDVVDQTKKRMFERIRKALSRGSRGARSSTGPARASKTPARATSCTKARLWSFRKYRATKTQNANSL